MLQRLFLATRNPGKARELRELLGAEFEVCCLPGDAPAVEESGKSFQENAALKARSACQVVEDWVVADDSGLEVDALAGSPGVRSARFAGEGASDAENIRRLLREMEGIGWQARTARFRCVVALARRGMEPQFFEGTVEGRIAMEPRGSGGFGYDPVFIPEGHSRTFSEFSPEEKNALSHRGRALQALAANWKFSHGEQP